MTSTTRERLDIRSVVRLTELADYIVPFALRVAASLGVADALAAGPRPVEEVAAGLGVDARSLHRVLRALASRGVFVEHEPGTFGLTPTAEPLRSDHPLSLRDAYPLMAADVEAWAELPSTLRTGRPAFDRVHGMRLWDFLAAHPEESEQFDRGMEALSRLELRALLPAYDWASLGTIVDVGGGNGAFLAAILRRHQALRGVVFDAPHVVANVAERLAAAGVRDRCEVAAGSFFDAVPRGGDAYVLKRILYGWEDTRAVDILRTVRAAMNPESRLLLLEPAIEGGDEPAVAAILDVVMLVVDGGKARTFDELAALLSAAGLELTRVVRTMMFPIVEARPV